MSKFIREIFSDEKGVGSSTRTAMLFGVLMGGIINLIMAINDTANEWIFASWIAASGGVYGWAKQSDNSVKKEQIKADASPNVVIPNSEKVEIKTDVTNVDSKSAS